MTSSGFLGGDSGKYAAIAAIAFTAVAGLFIGFLWGNAGTAGALSVGTKGVAISISRNERLEDVIDRVLRRPKASSEREALIGHMLRVISQDPDVGLRVVRIAANSEKPFDWDYRNAEVRYEPSLPKMLFGVCSESTELHGLISVQVLNKATKEFTSEGNILSAVPIRNCGPRAAANIIYTSNNSLVQAARIPNHVAMVRSTIIVPESAHLAI
jgi:hypothetical protein